MAASELDYYFLEACIVTFPPKYIAVIMLNDFAHEVTGAFSARVDAEVEAKRRIVELSGRVPQLVGTQARFHYSVHRTFEVTQPNQTEGFTEAIERAYRIATDAGHRSVGTQHLLLAVLGDESLATQALALMGIFVDCAELRAHVLALTNPNV